jgi:hypothetical protein
MNNDSGAKSGFENLVDDVKGRVKAAKDRGPRAALEGLVDDVRARVAGVIGRVTGRRDEAAGASETQQQAEQRRAREIGKPDVARAGAAKQAAEQELAREGHVDAARTSASKRRAKKQA